MTWRSGGSYFDVFSRLYKKEEGRREKASGLQFTAFTSMYIDLHHYNILLLAACYGLTTGVVPWLFGLFVLPDLRVLRVT